MEIKKKYILFAILFLMLIITVQSVSAEDNSTLDNIAESVDGNDDLNLQDDFSIPKTVNVNSTKKVNIEINSTQTVQKQDLKIKLNKTGEIKDIENFEVTNNIINFALEDNDFTKAILHVNYKDVNATTTLNNIINIKIEPLKTSAQFYVGAWTLKITDIDTGEAVKNKSIRIKIPLTGAVTYEAHADNTTDDQGIVTFNTNSIYNPSVKSDNLEVGEHNFTISGIGQLKGTLKTTLTVEKTDVIITPIPYKEAMASNEKFKVKVTNKETGVVMKGAVLSLYIPQSRDLYYPMTTGSDGIASISVSELNIGDYSATISTNDSNLNPSEANTNIIITKEVKLSVESVTKYFNSGKTTVIKVTDLNGNALSNIPVQIKIDGLSYVYRTNSKGKIEFSTSVNIGKHKLAVNVLGSMYISNSVEKTFTVKKAQAKLSILSKTYYYKSGQYITVKLTNTKNKKAVFNARIHFKIKVSKTKYNNYYGTSNIDGKIKFNNELNPGTYEVIISGDDSKNFNAKSLKTKLIVKKSPIKIKTKTKNKKLQITATNKKSKKPVSGIRLNVKVQTGSKYKTFNVKTNSKGISNLNLKSVKSGAHKVVISTNDGFYTLKSYKTKVKI